jgi:hypothetical protein
MVVKAGPFGVSKKASRLTTNPAEAVANAIQRLKNFGMNKSPNAPANVI